MYLFHELIRKLHLPHLSPVYQGLSDSPNSSDSGHRLQHAMGGQLCKQVCKRPSESGDALDATASRQLQHAKDMDRKSDLPSTAGVESVGEERPPVDMIDLAVTDADNLPSAAGGESVGEERPTVGMIDLGVTSADNLPSAAGAESVGEEQPPSGMIDIAVTEADNLPSAAGAESVSEERPPTGMIDLAVTEADVHTTAVPEGTELQRETVDQLESSVSTRPDVNQVTRSRSAKDSTTPDVHEVTRSQSAKESTTAHVAAHVAVANPQIEVQDDSVPAPRVKDLIAARNAAKSVTVTPPTKLTELEAVQKDPDTMSVKDLIAVRNASRATIPASNYFPAAQTGAALVQVGGEEVSPHTAAEVQDCIGVGVDMETSIYKAAQLAVAALEAAPCNLRAAAWAACEARWAEAMAAGEDKSGTCGAAALGSSSIKDEALGC